MMISSKSYKEETGGPSWFQAGRLSLGWLALFVVSSIVMTSLVMFGGIALQNQFVIDGILAYDTCMALVATSGLDELMTMPELATAANFTLLVLCTSYIPVLIVAAISWKRSGKTMSLPRASLLLPLLAAAALFNLLLEIPASLLSPFIPQEQSDMLALVSALATGGNSVLTFIVTGILAPIVEEVVLRRGVQRPLQKLNPIIAIIVASALFGVMHGNLVQGVFAGLFGLLLGFAYYKTDNLAYPIAMHMVVNLSGCAISVLVLPELPAYTAIAIVFCLFAIISARLHKENPANLLKNKSQLA